MTVTKTEPSAPPLEDDEIPVVAATAIPAAANFVPTASATAYVPDMPTAANPPPGMSMVTKTVTYPDGRKVTTTEYAPNNTTAAPAPAPAVAPRAATTQHHPPRRDLGSRSCSVSCPYCQHTGLTKTSQQCGECTWISAILLLLFCFPLFWVPFVCPSCYDTEHFCRNCGKVVGWSRADCCNNR
mmetsp:Transcript_28727/g.42856  ORF Transcript_28727/g.42856 Transcript_28727/m.42856 type:complete len:184 (+) Transcript_28727:62-613(+)